MQILFALLICMFSKLIPLKENIFCWRIETDTRERQRQDKCANFDVVEWDTIGEEHHQLCQS